MSSSSTLSGPVGMWDAIQLRCHDTGSGGMGLCREAKSWSEVAGRYHLRHRRAVGRPGVCVAISTTGDWMKRVFSGSSGYYKSANHPDRTELLSEARFSRELEWHRTNYERVGEIEPPPIFPFWRKQEFEARSLTRKVLELTRKRQLNQILKLVETAKQERYELHRITMNAVMEACVHCNDTDRAIGIFEEMLRPGACGVDTVTYGILIKGLGQAKRLSDAFLVFEAIENGTAPGAPKLSDVHLNTLVNACAEAGESLRARGILLRYRSSVDQSGPSAFTYNLLIKGYARSDNPLEALKVIDEMRSNGLEPQQLTYNSLILACVRGGDTLKALDVLRQMKEEAKRLNSPEMLPDVVTYTTLIKGLALDGDLQRVLDMVDEMKQTPTCVLDRVAYTAIIDACIEAGSPRQGFVMLQELKERGQENPALRPRAHVFLALMRAFADEGDVEMVTSLRERLIPEAAGFVWPEERAEADELLMEAAVSAGQLGLAKHVLRTMVGLKKGIPLTRRAYTTVVRLQALTRFKEDIFSPLQLRVPPSESVDRVMLPFAEANTVSEDLKVADVAFRFFREDVIPVVDKAGAYVGSVHCRDCTEMDARLGDLKKRTPIVTNATPISKVVSLLLKSPSPFITVIDSRTASYRKGDLLEGQEQGRHGGSDGSSASQSGDGGKVFVTVGTTRFDALVEAVDEPRFLAALRERGFSSLVIQLGRGSYLPASAGVSQGGFKLEFFTFAPDIAHHIRSADLVISHAGSGSVFETLRAGSPLVVVVNEALMDNHQSELAQELAGRKHLFCATPSSLVDVVRNMDLSELVPYPASSPAAMVKSLDQFLGFG